MNKELKALEKIDHTICLNINKKTLKFGLDDLDHADCKDFLDYAKCYNTIKSAFRQAEKEHKALKILKKHLHFEIDSYDCDDMSSSFECICVDDLGAMELTEDELNTLMEVLKNE